MRSSADAVLSREHADQPCGERRRSVLRTRGTRPDSECSLLVVRTVRLRLTWELGQLLLSKRNRIRGGGVVRNCRRGLAVVLQGFVLLAQFFVGLADHALDKRIVLVRLFQFFESRLVISRVER